MQNWIHNREIRKPFKHKQIPLGDELPKFSWEFYPNHQNRKYGKPRAAATIFIVILLCTLFGLSCLKIGSYLNEQAQLMSQTDTLYYEAAFEFLFEQGIYEYENQDYEKAITEFQLALNVKPNDYHTNLFLVYAMARQCETGKIDCSELEKRIKDLLVEFPGDPKLIQLQKGVIMMKNMKDRTYQNL